MFRKEKINMSIITTSSKWVSDLEFLASEPSKYKNKYPYNLLYWNGSYWTGDCLNTLKALFNGRNVKDKKLNSYQSNLKNTGDITELQMINKCTSVSTDFTKLKKGVPEVLYMKGHIGTYIGKEKTISGKVYNVIECTTNYGGGIVYSYIDSNGYRYDCKGGKRSSVVWEKHGKPTQWVEYDTYKVTKQWGVKELAYYSSLEVAKNNCPVGYKVFDSFGKCVFDNKPICPYADPTVTLFKGCPKGDDVRWLQWHLVKTGFLASEFDGKTNIDGSFGARTEQALIKFQTKYPECGNSKGQPDGRCGAKSRAKLKSLVKVDYVLPMPSPIKVTCPYGEPKTTLYRGCAKGSDVKWLQWHLIKLGFLAEKYDGVHDSLDGSFGSATEKAFKKFQESYPETGKLNKLTGKYEPDGRCGEGSRKKLKSLI